MAIQESQSGDKSHALQNSERFTQIAGLFVVRLPIDVEFGPEPCQLGAGLLAQVESKISWMRYQLRSCSSVKDAQRDLSGGTGLFLIQTSQRMVTFTSITPSGRPTTRRRLIIALFASRLIPQIRTLL